MVRHALAHFYKLSVKPFLKLPGVVEIDETKVSQERGIVLGAWSKHPTIKWMFGMFCRHTKLCIMYNVKNRMVHNLHPLLKKHIPQGNVVISDEHASYMSTISMRSKLAQFGWFHYFINHNSGEYAHRKFPFVSTN